VKNSLLALAMSAALLMSAAAHTQTTQLKVTVPFEFIAGDTVLPAGDYDVQSVDTWGGKALSIHNMTSNAGTLLLSNSCQLAKTSDSNKLVFYRYGQRYFLAKVWTANTNIGREMPLNQRQRELAKNQQKSEVVLMASGK
jgi:hypothetical protein